MQAMKEGGLRFALNLHLVGQQNTPVKGSWLAHQGDDGVLNMIFKDNTAMFSIRLREHVIVVDRFVNGKSPSLQYLLQESVLLHAVLDELHALAFEGDDVKQEETRGTLSASLCCAHFAVPECHVVLCLLHSVRSIVRRRSLSLFVRIVL